MLGTGSGIVLGSMLDQIVKHPNEDWFPSLLMYFHRFLRVVQSRAPTMPMEACRCCKGVTFKTEQGRLGAVFRRDGRHGSCLNNQKSWDSGMQC